MSAGSSMRRSRLLLEAFLEREHLGDPLDRPVMEYLAGAVADAADDATCNADVEAMAAMVAEMTAEYLFPPQPGTAIIEDIARMIRAVRAPAEPAPAAAAVVREAPPEPAGALEPSLSAGATEFVPRAAAAEFVPGGMSAPPGFSGAAQGEGGEGSWVHPWAAEASEYFSGGHCDDGDPAAGADWEQAVADLPESEAMELLAMQFPHYSLEQLQSLLAAYGGNVAVTMDVLLQFEGDYNRQMQMQQQAAAGAEPEELPVPEEPPEIDNTELFPTLGSSPAAAGASPGGWGRSVDFAGALKKQAQPPARPQPPRASTASPRASAGPSWSGSGVGGPSAAVTWVETGAAVDSMYRGARGDARDHARIRNMYFQQATQAYLAGNRALAKELGAKGRAAGAAMKEAHARASQQIFQSRNRLGGEEGMIDLHGLHTKEAIMLLGSELERYKLQGRTQVFVLVGTGHHTKTHRSTLPEAVENFLKEKMVSFRVAQAGCLELRLC